MNPIEWAKQLIKTQGFDDAKRIAEFYSRPTLGKEPDVVTNPHKNFYKSALIYINKNTK